MTSLLICDGYIMTTLTNYMDTHTSEENIALLVDIFSGTMDQVVANMVPAIASSSAVKPLPFMVKIRWHYLSPVRLPSQCGM